MSETIRFSVHRNPKTDASAPDTFHVRHETLQTVGNGVLMPYLKNFSGLQDAQVDAVLDSLPRVIVNQLLDNHNVHIDGLGTFSLTLGFRTQGDEDNPVKPHFTDAAAITGNHVEIKGITFKPAKDFLSLLFKDGHHFENATGRGKVGRSDQLTEQQVRQFITDYLAENPHITRRTLQFFLHLTEHTAGKWLARFTEGPSPLLRGDKAGNTFIYTLRK